MVEEASAVRGFSPQYILFDSWYTGGLANLKLLKGLGWRWLTKQKNNQLVDPDGRGNIPVRELAGLVVNGEGKVVHLKGYGFIKVFLTVGRNGNEEYWATNDLEMDSWTREELARGGLSRYSTGA